MIRPSVVRSVAAALGLAAAAAAQAQARPATTSPAPARIGRDDGDGARALGTWAMVVFNTRPFDFPNTGGAAPLPLTIYTLGLRRWATEPLGPFRAWGLDLGVGFNLSRSSITQPQTGTLTTRDGAATSGIGLHAGLPLVVSLHQHALFELVPEADVIWAKETIPPVGTGETTRYSGWSARLGARAGFEIFFGFIGIPQLAIEASMGASLAYDSVGSHLGAIERSTRRWSIATLRGDEPWSIFSGSVAAMYHF